MLRINVYTVKQVKEKGGLYDLASKRIRSPEDAYDIIEEVLNLGEAAQEVFGIITLSTKNDVAGIHVISIGSLNAAIVHPREVFKSAMLNNAAAFVASGDPNPSMEYRTITQRLVEG